MRQPSQPGGVQKSFRQLRENEDQRMTIKQGWTGRVYEDFEVGDIYQHPLGRTVIAADNIWFTLLTQNTNPVHFDHAYATKTEYGKPLVNSAFTLALVTGQSVMDISQNAMANLGWDAVRLPAPVFEGDTIYARWERVEKSGHELVLAPVDLDEIFPVNAVSIGYVRDLSHGNKIDIGLGGQVSLDFWPDELDRYYGGGPGYGFQVFLRVRPSRHDHAGQQSHEMK